MATRWLLVLLVAPCFGGCGATTIVTPELKLGPSVVTLTTDIIPDETQSFNLAGEQMSISALELGLRSTIRF
ncbi:MAG: hypothetical protein ACYC9I_03360 [Desulfuromonadales bacterium]